MKMKEPVPGQDIPLSHRQVEFFVYATAIDTGEEGQSWALVIFGERAGLIQFIYDPALPMSTLLSTGVGPSFDWSGSVGELVTLAKMVGDPDFPSQPLRAGDLAGYSKLLEIYAIVIKEEKEIRKLIKEQQKLGLAPITVLSLP